MISFMANENTALYEDAIPKPSDLIESIAEQGYSLQAALADLIDNSISANATQIEILVSTDDVPFRLYIADNGDGMTESELSSAMKLPSQSPMLGRKNSDLGRFGLGMKTASFSQTKRFTVASKANSNNEFRGRTWDLSVLEQGSWKIKINSDPELDSITSKYKMLSESFMNAFEDFNPKTIIVWNGLHKFEEFISERNREDILLKELKEVTAEYLSIVFHRFMERKKKPIRIRLNNRILSPFNPFPYEKDMRSIAPNTRNFNNDKFSIEGFVLPARAIRESRGNSIWTTKYQSLYDMEGIYVYRSDRLISFGGWSNISKKSARHNLARLKVDIGNNNDLRLHLNVAKSQVKIPDDLRDALKRYIEDLKAEAAREYNNKSVRPQKNGSQKNQELLNLVPTSKGVTFEINDMFPLFRTAFEGLNKLQASSFKFILKMLVVKLNMIRDSHQQKSFITEIKSESTISEKELEDAISKLRNSGIPPEIIKKDLIPSLGYSLDSIPNSVLKILE